MPDPLSMFWFLPTTGDGSFLGSSERHRPAEYGYLREIARKSRRYFYSINQESEGPMGADRIPQTLVPRLADAVPELSRIQRFPYWLRRGYVEELYEVGGRPSPSA